MFKTAFEKVAIAITNSVKPFSGALAAGGGAPSNPNPNPNGGGGGGPFHANHQIHFGDSNLLHNVHHLTLMSRVSQLEEERKQKKKKQKRDESNS